MTCGPPLWQTRVKHLKVGQPTHPAGQLLCFQLILGIHLSPRFIGEILPSLVTPIHMNDQNGSSFIIGNLSNVKVQEAPLFFFWKCSSWYLSLKVKVAQSCLTLCNPMDYTAHGILQARILEWVAYPFSRGSSRPRNWTRVSCIAGGFFTSWATREAPIN